LHVGHKAFCFSYPQSRSYSTRENRADGV